jgi:hypothetical protein
MKVLVCGGRDYNKTSMVFFVLDSLRPRPTQIISGNARGADKLGEMWAQQNNVACRVFPANWDKYGKRAGYLRNQQMLDEGIPDLVIAFPGGNGTKMMMSIAEAADIKVIEVTDELLSKIIAKQTAENT